MSSDEMRIAVAECLGYVKAPGKEIAWKHPSDLWRNPVYDLPNFTTSLDACAEFERTLNHDDEWRNYLGYLKQLVKGCTQLPHLMSMEDLQRCWNATPLQRCEAYLRVKGKWQDATEGRE